MPQLTGVFIADADYCGDDDGTSRLCRWLCCSANVRKTQLLLSLRIAEWPGEFSPLFYWGYSFSVLVVIGFLEKHNMVRTKNFQSKE